MKRIYLETLGCAKNQVESEKLLAFFKFIGYETASEPENADLLYVNTCSFLDASRKESLQVVNELHEIKTQQSHKPVKLIVGGCYAQYDKEGFLKSLPTIDYVHQPDDHHGIMTFLNYQKSKDFDSSCFSMDRVISTYPGSAYLKISEGCNRRCAFCTIPSFKGPLHSYQIDSLVLEAKSLVSKGVKELVLISQDTIQFGKDSQNKKSNDLGTLVDALSQIEGLIWIRLMYLYPDKSLLAAIPRLKAFPKLVPYFDMPVQHFSNEVLRKMNRSYSYDHIKEVIAAFRETFNDLSLRTTFIVGFPGETEDDIELLYHRLDDIQFDWAGFFSFSKELGTDSFSMEGQVSKDTIQKRIARAQQIQENITKTRQARFMGKTLDVLIEEDINFEDGRHYYFARSAHQAPEDDGSIIVHSTRQVQAGDMHKALIVQQNGIDLFGSMLEL